jgi:hypothetical protein
MNTMELEQLAGMRMKISESKEREMAYSIDYLNQPFYKNMRNTLLGQILTRERMLLNTKDRFESNVLEKETLVLKLILDLLEYL